MPDAGLSGWTDEIRAAGPNALTCSTTVALITAHAGAEVFNAVPFDTGLSHFAANPPAGILDADPIYAGLQERTAHLRAARDALPLAAVFTRITVNSGAWVRNTFDTIATDRALWAAGLTASILDTLTEPAAILFLFTDDPLTGIGAHQVLFITAQAELALNTYTGGQTE